MVKTIKNRLMQNVWLTCARSIVVLLTLWAADLNLAGIDAVSASSIDSRLKFASQLSIDSYHVTADVLEKNNDKEANTKISKEFDAFKNDLEKKLTSGTLPQHWPLEIKSLDGKKKSEVIERYKQRDISNFQSILRNKYSNIEKSFGLDLYTDSHNREKKIKDFHYRIRDGIKKPSKQVEVRAFTEDYSAIYLPLSGFASIDLGSHDDTGLTVKFGEQSFGKAGTPFFYNMSEKNIIDQKDLVYGNDSVTRVVYSEAIESAGNRTVIMDLLPDKDYKLKSSITICNGKITQVFTFGDYRQINKDNWYPYYQKYQIFDKAEYDGLVSDIQNARWENIITHLNALEFKQTQCNEYSIKSFTPTEVPFNTYDISLSANTKIVDTRYDKQIRMIAKKEILASEVAQQSRPGTLPAGVIAEEGQARTEIAARQVISEALNSLNAAQPESIQQRKQAAHSGDDIQHRSSSDVPINPDKPVRPKRLVFKQAAMVVFPCIIVIATVVAIMKKRGSS